MPFAAMVGDQYFISTLATDEEWATLRQASKDGRLIMYWSGLQAVARTSPLGLRHFAHKAGVCDDNSLYAPESAQHLALKARVIHYAIQLGWTALTEVMSPTKDWIADTLLISPHQDRRIAVEIQWSSQSPLDYIRRQERYEKMSVQCLWIHRHPCEEPAVPRARLVKPSTVLDDPDPIVEFNSPSENIQLHLSQLIARIVSDEGLLAPVSEQNTPTPEPQSAPEPVTQKHPNQPTPSTTLRIDRFNCWKCNRDYLGYIGPSRLQWATEKPFVRNPSLPHLIQQALDQRPRWRSLPQGFYSMRYSSIVGRKYLALCCPQCNTLQGDFHLYYEEGSHEPVYLQMPNQGS